MHKLWYLHAQINYKRLAADEYLTKNFKASLGLNNKIN